MAFKFFLLCFRLLIFQSLPPFYNRARFYLVLFTTFSSLSGLFYISYLHYQKVDRDVYRYHENDYTKNTTILTVSLKRNDRLDLFANYSAIVKNKITVVPKVVFKKSNFKATLNLKVILRIEEAALKKDNEKDALKKPDSEIALKDVSEEAAAAVEEIFHKKASESCRCCYFEFKARATG